MLLLIGGGVLAVPAPLANAGIDLTDQLTISSDFRFRFEIDDQRGVGSPAIGEIPPSPGDTSTRDRWRIRFRLGFTYDLTDRVQFGMRLRTEADSVQSPQTNLGQVDFSQGARERSAQTNSPNFGLDRAYIRFRWLAGGFAWLGKNQVAIWQQNEQFWDADFQAEGGTIGYVFRFRDKNKLTLQGSYYLIREDDFQTNGVGGGVFNDRAIMPVQAIYDGNLGPVGLTVAGLVAPTNMPDNTPPGNFPGGERTYYMGSVQAKLKNLPFPATVGYELYYGNHSTVGHGVALRVKPLKEVPLELRGYYYYVPLNSVPLQGAIVQDDFRFSSNFKGFQVVASYLFGPNLNLLFRIMSQDTINETFTRGANQGQVPGLGAYVQPSGYTTRYQMDLDIKF